MNINKLYIALAVAIGATNAPMAWAQPRAYTLDELRELALTNNVAMRNAANSLEGARHDRREAFTNYFPELSASGAAYNANKGIIEMNMGPDVGSMSMLKNGVVADVTLTQPIFAGGQIVNGNRLAALGVEIGEIQQEKSHNEVALTVERYYWQVVTLQEKLVTLQTVERQLASIESDVEAAVGAGITTRNDLLQVQLRTNDVASSRINLENNLGVCRMVLAQYAGLGDDTIAVVADMAMDHMPPFPADLRVDHSQALPLTTDYRLLESDLRANKLQHKLAVGKQLPTVAVGAGYMYDNLSDRDSPFAMGFVTVAVPISGWWGGSHSIRKQKLLVMNAENRLADSSELLVIAMEKAWTDLEDAYKQLVLANKSIEQSTENLRLNQDYYRAGTATMSDLLDAQTLFRQSRDRYVDAYAQLRMRTTEYLQATGR